MQCLLLWLSFKFWAIFILLGLAPLNLTSGCRTIDFANIFIPVAVVSKNLFSISQIKWFLFSLFPAGESMAEAVADRYLDVHQHLAIGIDNSI